MNRVAKFYKVSFEQFLNDIIEAFPGFNYNDSEKVKILVDTYEKISLPQRSTASSAGYDFYSPVDFDLRPGQSVKIPSGVKCEFQNDYVLMIYPRSSLGFKYGIGLANTTGIIDSDYINADNEGHIMFKLVNNGDKVYSASAGDKIVQGIFLPYGITIDDEAEGERTGGFGSTGA